MGDLITSASSLISVGELKAETLTGEALYIDELSTKDLYIDELRAEALHITN